MLVYSLAREASGVRPAVELVGFHKHPWHAFRTGAGAGSPRRAHLFARPPSYADDASPPLAFRAPAAGYAASPSASALSFPSMF